VAFLKLSFLMLGALAFSHLVMPVEHYYNNNTYAYDMSGVSFDRRKYGGEGKEGKVKKFKYRR
jgi:hypothetical protein